MAGDPQQPPQPPGPDPEAARVQGLDERFGKIEAEQQKQRGLLDSILAAVTGKPAAPAPQNGPPAAPGAPQQLSQPSVAEQVTAGIEAAEQRRQEQARAQGEADWKAKVDAALETIRPETPPREPQTGIRGRLQRLTVGRPG